MFFKNKSKKQIEQIKDAFTYYLSHYERRLLRGEVKPTKDEEIEFIMRKLREVSEILGPIEVDH